MPYAEFSVARIYSGMTEGTVYVPARSGKGLNQIAVTEIYFSLDVVTVDLS